MGSASNSAKRLFNRKRKNHNYLDECEEDLSLLCTHHKVAQSKGTQAIIDNCDHHKINKPITQNLTEDLLIKKYEMLIECLLQPITLEEKQSVFLQNDEIRVYLTLDYLQMKVHSLLQQEHRDTWIEDLIKRINQYASVRIGSKLFPEKIFRMCFQFEGETIKHCEDRMTFIILKNSVGERIESTNGFLKALRRAEIVSDDQ